jgi:hypothetical protein
MSSEKADDMIERLLITEQGEEQMFVNDSKL